MKKKGRGGGHSTPLLLPLFPTATPAPAAAVPVATAIVPLAGAVVDAAATHMCTLPSCWSSCTSGGDGGEVGMVVGWWR